LIFFGNPAAPVGFSSGYGDRHPHRPALAVTTAVFVREVAPDWAREILKPLIEVLAGHPSVVLGFFGMHVVAPLIRETLGVPTGLTVFTGGLILAYMALPTIISVAEDALDAVPKSFRDAGLAMGATQWQTIWRVVVPAARSGITTAVMLGMGRWPSVRPWRS